MTQSLIKCNECNGTGIGKSNYYACSKCLGRGELDWVENITGKSPPTSGYHIVNLTDDNIHISDIYVQLSPKSITNIESIIPTDLIFKSEDIENLIQQNKICVIDKTGYFNENI